MAFVEIGVVHGLCSLRSPFLTVLSACVHNGNCGAGVARRPKLPDCYRVTSYSLIGPPTKILLSHPPGRDSTAAARSFIYSSELAVDPAYRNMVAAGRLLTAYLRSMQARQSALDRKALPLGT